MRYLLTTLALVIALLPGGAIAAEGDALIFTGFETGDALEFTGESGTAATQWNTGCPDSGDYCFRGAVTDSTADFVWFDLDDANLVGSSAQATTYAKFDFEWSDPNFASEHETKILVLEQTDLGNIASIRLVITAADTGHLELWLEEDGAAESQVGSDYSINANQWYRIELKTVINATTGELDMRVDGTSRASGTSLDTGTENTNSFNIGMVGASTEVITSIHFDDFAISTSDWYGASDVYRLDPNALGNANDWDTLNGSGTSRWNYVDDVPVNTTNNIEQAANATGVEMFNLDDATGTVGASDTVNAVRAFVYTDSETSGGPGGGQLDATYEENGTVAAFVTSLAADQTAYSLTWSTPPQSGGSWNLTKVDAFEVGVDKSTAGARDSNVYEIFGFVDYKVAEVAATKGPADQHLFWWDS